MPSHPLGICTAPRRIPGTHEKGLNVCIPCTYTVTSTIKKTDSAVRFINSQTRLTESKEGQKQGTTAVLVARIRPSVATAADIATLDGVGKLLTGAP